MAKLSEIDENTTDNRFQTVNMLPLVHVQLKMANIYSQISPNK